MSDFRMPETRGRLSRRGFLLQSALMMAPLTLPSRMTAEDLPTPLSRIGLITDLHFADKSPAGSRFYRESLLKLREAGALYRELGVSHVVELGDLVDAADSVAVEQSYLSTIHRELGKIPGHKHYVLGNHCVDTLTKEEFLTGVGASKSFESFDEAGFHFVILDACFRSDGQPYGRRNFDWTDPNIPDDQVHWLERDLASTRLPVVVFVHQRLDVGAPYGIKNAATVRAVLEKSGKVASVFQGHSHKNDHQVIQGISYVTLVAMVEGAGPTNSGYSVLNLHADGRVSLTGHRRQKSYQW